MDKPAVDFSRFYETLFKIDKRLTALEKDSIFIEKKIGSIDMARKNRYEELGKSLEQQKTGLEGLHKDLKFCLMEMIKASSEMKTAVKKDQVVQLNNELDLIQFEQYITRLDLEKGV